MNIKPLMWTQSKFGHDRVLRTAIAPAGVGRYYIAETVDGRYAAYFIEHFNPRPGAIHDKLHLTAVPDLLELAQELCGRHYEERIQELFLTKVTVKNFDPAPQ